MNPCIIEILKIAGHIALPALITLAMLKMRFHPVLCVAMVFCLVSSKEIYDLCTVVPMLEYDDILMNLCGSVLGYISAG